MLVGRRGADNLSAADLTGCQLGDYRLLERIGSGGMGVVYLAEHVHLRKCYAVKVLPFELAEDAGFVARFHDEARVMAELRHERIVQVHSMSQAVVELGDERRTVYFLAMDYVAGPTGRPLSLHEQLKLLPEGRLPESQLRTWAIQIAEALAYAHQRGLVHRDLKPANILIDAAGNVKLTDFGLAKAVGQEFILSQIHETIQRSLGSLPTVGSGGPVADVLDVAAVSPAGEGSGSGRSSGASSILGTYDYMAPEQRGEAAAEIRPWTDVYALGVVLYRLLTGRRPSGLAERPSRLVPGISRQWDRIVSRCMATEPSDRFPSATELIGALRAIRPKAPRHVPRWLVLSPALLLVALLAVGALYGPRWLVSWQLWQENIRLQAFDDFSPGSAAPSFQQTRTHLAKLAKTTLDALHRGEVSAAWHRLQTLRAGLAALETAREAWQQRLDPEAAPDLRESIQQADAIFRRGREALEKGEYVTAKTHFDDARSRYAEAEAQHERHEEKAGEARKDWQDALARADGDLLRRYAGEQFERARQLAREAEQAFGKANFLKARNGYHNARDALRNAEAAAWKAERDEFTQRAKQAEESALAADVRRYAADLLRDAQALKDQAASAREPAEAIKLYKDAIRKFEQAAETAGHYAEGDRRIRAQLDAWSANEAFARQARTYAAELWNDLQAQREAIVAALESGRSAEARNEIERAQAILDRIPAAIEQGLCQEARRRAANACASSLAPDRWRRAEQAASGLNGATGPRADRWRRARALYDAAWEAASEQRQALVAQVTEVKTRAEALMTGGFLLAEEREALARQIQALESRLGRCDLEGWQDHVQKLLKDLATREHIASLRAQYAEARKTLLATIDAHREICERHGGELARRIHGIRSTWQGRRWENLQESWGRQIDAAQRSVEGALARLMGIARRVDALSQRARSAGIQLEGPSGFIGYRQYRAAQALLQELDRAPELSANPGDRRMAQLREVLRRWCTIPPWQFDGTQPGADPVAARRAAAKHLGVRERIRVALGHDSRETLVLVLVPPGWVRVADKIIELRRPLLVSETELTRGQWAALLDVPLTGQPNLPKTRISWYAAKRACRKLSTCVSQQADLPLGKCRLPTPEEWVYLAAGGETGPDAWYADPEKIEAMTWYVANSPGNAQIVGSPKAANPWGLFNILGNVQEWCADPSAPEGESGALAYPPVCGVAYCQPLPPVPKLERLLLECEEKHRADSEEDTIGMRILVEIQSPSTAARSSR